MKTESASSRACFARAIAIAALCVSLASCNKPKVESDDTPFSIGGIYLGLSREEAVATSKLGYCKPADRGAVECFSSPDDYALSFMGASVEYLTTNFYSAEDPVTGLSFFAKKKRIYNFDIERRWHLEGRCLDGWDASQLAKADSHARFQINALSEVKIYLSSSGSFHCMTTDRRFLKVSGPGSSGDQLVEMYFIKEGLDGIFENILSAATKYRDRKKEIDQRFNRTKPKLKLSD